MENKKIKLFLISLIAILFFIFISKQLLGYSPIGYLFNSYSNFFYSSEVITNTYKMKLPFFHWRINKQDNHDIILYGMKTKKGFLQASFENKFLSKSIDDVKMMCTDKNNKLREFNIDSHKAYDIYCENTNTIDLNQYRIIFIPEKLLIFMYDYQIEFEYEYEILIENININSSL